MPAKTQRRKATENRIKAMSHPLRASILRILTERTASPAEMARDLDEDLSNVSYHTKQLVGFECVELVSTRPVRGALEHFYRATERHLIDTEDWETLDPVAGFDHRQPVAERAHRLVAAADPDQRDRHLQDCCRRTHARCKTTRP